MALSLAETGTNNDTVATSSTGTTAESSVNKMGENAEDLQQGIACSSLVRRRRRLQSQTSV